MNFLGVLLKLKFPELITLTGTFILSPHYIIPTIKATTLTIRKCNARFGDRHHGDNPANAYRHALWNILICERIHKQTGSSEKSVNWALKITNLHEDLSPNEKLERAMDLHNNTIGREVFLESLLQNINSSKLLDIRMGEAVLVKELKDIEKAKNKLVFLELPKT